MNDAIVTRGLTRRFAAANAVDGIDLKVPQGGVCGFLGPNGSGKTTTIRMLLGLLRPSSGASEVLGLPAGHPEALRRIGALVEMPSIYPHLTGKENLQVTALMRGCPESNISWALGMVGIEDVARYRASTYSLGMRQRLGLALALLSEPDLLILDEPTNGLDPAGIQDMRRLISHLPKELGVTVFLSSHMLHEVEQVATHVVMLNQGKLKFQGTLEELHALAQPVLEVETGDDDLMVQVLGNQGFEAKVDENGILVKADRLQAPKIADAIFRQGLPLYRLMERRASLEHVFMSMMEEK